MCAPPLPAHEQLPPHYVERSDHLKSMRAALLGDPAGVASRVAALVSAGGYGKATLAIALCHDEQVSLWHILGGCTTKLSLLSLVQRAPCLVGICYQIFHSGIE
jgi:hypothetical protein